MYETLEARPIGDTGGIYYRCRRALLEIKTPWKLRTRPVGADFYPQCHQRNGRVNGIPNSYYDQVIATRTFAHAHPNVRVVRGNSYLMGLSLIYFVVLSPSGIQVQIELFDPVYVNQSLLPSLLEFWHQQVLPAFEERDRLGGVAPTGWIPEASGCPPRLRRCAPDPSTRKRRLASDGGATTTAE